MLGPILALQEKHGLLAEQVLQPDRLFDAKPLAASIEGEGVFHFRIDDFDEICEIADRAQVSVGRLIPGFGQVLSHRHATAQKETAADLPVTEVGK